MWYKDIVLKLDKDSSYTRKQIYETLLKEKPELSYNSFKWILSDMVKNGIIIRNQRDRYIFQADSAVDKDIYKPVYNDRAKEITRIIQERFPLIDFVCFESVQLNEFLNHLIAQNTYFFMVERDALDSVFRYLQDVNVGNILLKPGRREWDAYWTGETIVLLNLVSESPENPNIIHGMSIEQLLVDIIAEKTFQYLYSKSEVQRIYESADKSYLIGYARLLRYARRRGKAEEVKKYIGGFLDAYTG